MAIRANHYDAAFEEYLRTARIPYVAVDEARRALCGDGSLKSLDFIVYSPELGNLLVDVKGRKSGGTTLPGRQGENWATADDLTSLARWESLFGTDFRALLVFAYLLPQAAAAAEHRAEAFRFRAREYAFYGVWVNDYQAAMRQRSPKWETVWVPAAPYRQLRFPLTQPPTPAVAG